MNPPCVGDQTSCGHQYNRTTACYQLPANFDPVKVGANWTTATGVTSVSSTYCPDVAGFPTYDSATGAVVTRGTDGKVVLTTTCPPCNYATSVLPWQRNPCPCLGAGNFCNAPSGTTGVCQLNNSIMCNTTDCNSAPTRASVSSQQNKYPGYRIHFCNRPTF